MNEETTTGTEERKKRFSATLKFNGGELQSEGNTILQVLDGFNPENCKTKGEIQIRKNTKDDKRVFNRLIVLRLFRRLFIKDDSMMRKIARIQFAKLCELYFK